MISGNSNLGAIRVAKALATVIASFLTVGMTSIRFEYKSMITKQYFLFFFIQFNEILAYSMKWVLCIRHPAWSWSESTLNILFSTHQT